MKKVKSSAKIIVVTSGKGGVGKTTTSASIATGLAEKGHKTVVIDFDIGLRNLDIVLGCENRVIYDFIDVINGKAELSQALIRGKRGQKNLYILAASQTHDKDALTTEGVLKVITGLKKQGFEYIICDSPAGIEAGAHHAMYFADEAIVVTNPEISSIRDSDKVIGLLESKTLKAEAGQSTVKAHLLITRYDAKMVKEGSMLSVEDINEILCLDLIGVIPESKDVVEASNKGTAVIVCENSKAADGYRECVARLTGEDIPVTIPSHKRRLFSGWFK
jgi:septum site-determining protein MinD